MFDCDAWELGEEGGGGTLCISVSPLAVMKINISTSVYKYCCHWEGRGVLVTRIPQIIIVTVIIGVLWKPVKLVR